MKDNLIEDMIRISNQLVATQSLLCNKYKLSCGDCPLYILDDCADFNDISCLEYNEVTGKFE